MKVKFHIRFLPLFITGLLLFAVGRSCFGGGWYVGNTAPGEWIQFTNVWLSAGNYRFTANAGSPSNSALMHLEIDGVNIRPGVAVPNIGRVDTFAPVQLGFTNLSQGYHTLRAVFETSGVSLDWFMLRKDSDTTTNVKASDTVLVRPSTAGMLVAPIVSYNQQSGYNSYYTANDAIYNLGSVPETATNGVRYSDYQMMNWYRVPMFEDFDRRTDRYWDIMVDQLMAARAQVPLMQCRSTSDFTHDLQDRAYIVGDGAFEGRWLQKLAEAVQRNPQAASSLQIGTFVDDGPLPSDYFSKFGSYPSWGSTNLADYFMTNWMSPWFDHIPKSMLYQPFPNRPIINIWTAHPTGMTNNAALDGGMAAFVTNICTRMIAKYGLNPLFIVSPDADTATQSAAWGDAPWYTWGQTLFTLRTYLDGSVWGFSSCGSRERLDLTWANDWNPISNTGTPSGGSAGQDNYQSPLTNGNSTLLGFYSQAAAAHTKFIQEEGFYNLPEGSPIYASSANGWNYPNQHLAAMRQYADPTTESLMFEAEDCDQYYKTSVHENLGGSYRRQWYSTTGLDVYRPLHNTNTWASKSTGPGNLASLSAGFFDVWALDANGLVWAHCISDGAPDTWASVSLNGVTAKFTSLSVGKHHVWAINGSSVYTCQLNYSQSTQNHGTWASVSGSMVQLSVNEADVWAVDSGGSVYFRRVNEVSNPGDTWHPVSGPGSAVNKIYAGGNGKFLWAMCGTNIYYSPINLTNVNNVFTVITNMNWTQVDNVSNLTQLSIGSEEVWGINGAGNIFRRSIAGVGNWDAVDGNVTKLAVGENYAWGLSGTTPSSRRLTGFLNAPLPSIPGIPMGVAGITGNTQAKLTWSPVLGAAGYNVKRGSASGGSYTNVVVSTTTNGVDAGLANGVTYYYVVTAFNSIGESTNSTQVSMTPTMTGVPPAAPTNLIATAGATQITLTWNTSAGATSYNVKRTTVFGGTFSTIATVIGPTNYTDTGLTPDTIYTYVVSAVNAAGESFTDSASASATPPGILLSRSGWVASASVNSSGASSAIDGNITTRWSTGGPQSPGQWFQINMGVTNSFYKLVLDATTASPSDYPRGYQVQVSNDGVNWSSSVTTGAGSSALTTIIFNSQTARYIRVTQTGSTTGNYWSLYEFNVYALPPAPTAPTNLIATAASSSQINLTWNTVSGANSYNVRRSATSGGTYSTIASGVTATNYADAGLSAVTSYYYVVSAVGAGSESTNSMPASATTQPSTTPTSIATALAGNTLSLSWPADHLGWRLQVQTNSLGTNWVTLPGSDQMTGTNITIDPANGGVFYRLVYP